MHAGSVARHAYAAIIRWRSRRRRRGYNAAKYERSLIPRVRARSRPVNPPLGEGLPAPSVSGELSITLHHAGECGERGLWSRVQDNDGFRRLAEAREDPLGPLAWWPL
ncbi:unnamed protein product [Lampetra planeri]